MLGDAATVAGQAKGRVNKRGEVLNSLHHLHVTYSLESAELSMLLVCSVVQPMIR